MSNSRVWSIAVSGDNIFAGTDSGVFLSTNYGKSWRPANQGLTKTCIHALLIAGNFIFAGTQGAGVWKRPLSEMITLVEEQSKSYFNQMECYPNPVNSLANIKFNLPSPTTVTLKIYDI